MLTFERPYLEAALQAARWIDQARVVTDHGVRWRSTLGNESTSTIQEKTWSLANGSIGPVLFLFELYEATGRESFLHEALAGVDHIAATLPFEGEAELGLYYGFAGAAYALELAHRIGGRKKDREAALRCLPAFRRHIPSIEGQFFGRGNDIFSGRAGFGLSLLWFHVATGNQEALDLALLAGKTVLQRARQHEKGGVYWFTGDGNPQMPGFALGSAGMAHFLAVLYEHTGERAYLDTAIEAARYILSTVIEYGDGYLIDPTTQNSGDIRESYGAYVGWYQGATGIWRLPFQLARVTDDLEWVSWVHRLARGAMSAFPERDDAAYESGKISNAGDAQISQSFLELHIAYRTPEYLAFSERIAAELLRRALADESGMRWEFFYHGQRITSTAFLGGASGIATQLLHFDRFQQQCSPTVLLPDSLFSLQSLQSHARSTATA